MCIRDRCIACKIRIKNSAKVSQHIRLKISDIGDCTISFLSVHFLEDILEDSEVAVMTEI